MFEKYLKKFESYVSEAIEEDPHFEEAYELARGNSLGGEIYIVGSFIYKNILKKEYGLLHLKPQDYDFVLERQVDYSTPFVKEGWKIDRSFFGAPKYVKDNMKVDVYTLKRRDPEKNFSETFKNYLGRALFDVQSIGYNVENGELIDVGAIRPLLEWKAHPLNLKACRSIAKYRGVSLEQYFAHKSNRIGIKIFY